MADLVVPHNDLPTLDDKLDWKDELKRLRQRIADCDTPHVLGIHGDWGSGKTSFMRQLQWQLGGKIPDDGSVSGTNGHSIPPDAVPLQQRIVTIWFDAWRYQHEPVPVVALLQEMRRQMSDLDLIKNKFPKTLEIALRYTLNSLTDSAEKIQAEGERWEKEHHASTLQTDSIREHLHTTIKALLPDEPKARIVVFIDDLDRCNATAAFRLLEELKIYLSIPNCVFVLGMNERALVDSLGNEIPSKNGVSEARAAHYLEKICPDIYRLPLPKDTALLFTKWLHDTQHGQALISALANISCLPPNPRRLKALANQWERFADCTSFPTTALPSIQESWAKRALIVAYINQFHRDIWERWHYNTDFWNEIKGWCLGERGSTNITIAPEPARPDWTHSLRLTYQTVWDEQNAVTQKRDFPNPGAIENFWIGTLIYRDQKEFEPQGFEPLLRQ